MKNAKKIPTFAPHSINYSMKGLLLAESGSSKTEWRLCTNGAVSQSLRSPGFNPNIQSHEAMRTVFREVIQTIGYEKIENVCFYGAGLGELSQRRVMANILKELVNDAGVQIEHDMLAAVRSTLKPEGIVCILGTGSNSALYKDDAIVENLGGYGYLFGDEGSGQDIGKRMIKAILQADLPKEAKEYFEQKEDADIDEIKIAVMKAEKPNVKLATFARLTADLLHVKGVEKIILESFLAFLDTTVCRYKGYQAIPADFVGSIAYYFRPILEKACQKRKVQIGGIQKDPVENLIQYHLAAVSS